MSAFRIQRAWRKFLARQQRNVSSSPPLDGYRGNNNMSPHSLSQSELEQESEENSESLGGVQVKYIYIYISLGLVR